MDRVDFSSGAAAVRPGRARLKWLVVAAAFGLVALVASIAWPSDVPRASMVARTALFAALKSKDWSKVVALSARIQHDFPDTELARSARWHSIMVRSATMGVLSRAAKLLLRVPSTMRPASAALHGYAIAHTHIRRWLASVERLDRADVEFLGRYCPDDDEIAWTGDEYTREAITKAANDAWNGATDAAAETVQNKDGSERVGAVAGLLSKHFPAMITSQVKQTVFNARLIETTTKMKPDVERRQRAMMAVLAVLRHLESYVQAMAMHAGIVKGAREHDPEGFDPGADVPYTRAEMRAILDAVKLVSEENAEALGPYSELGAEHLRNARNFGRIDLRGLPESR